MGLFTLRARRVRMALSGVDLALWDALGKAEGKRVCDLLGGVRRAKVRAYATGQDAERAATLDLMPIMTQQGRRTRRRFGTATVLGRSRARAFWPPGAVNGRCVYVVAGGLR